jgi:alpha-glucosidase
MRDQPEVHEVNRSWHRILDEAGADRMAVAEAWTQTPESMARFVRPDELDQAFNFAWLLADWSARDFADVITDTMAAVDQAGASATWVLSNHDVVRHTTRYGGGETGRTRARAATLTMLALPGSSYLYQGEELGLEQAEVAPEFRSDPSWLRTGEEGRDGCRVPIPWGGDEPPYEFGPGGEQPWIPQPDDWAGLTVAAQAADPSSTMSFYRAALAARREFATTAGETVELLDLGADVLAFRRGPVTVVLNCGTEPVALPAGDVLVASAPVGDGELPADTCVWLR